MINPKIDMVDHGSPSSIFILILSVSQCDVRPSFTMVDFRIEKIFGTLRHWTIIDQGWPWLTMLAMVDHYWSWFTRVDHHSLWWPWLTIINHGWMSHCDKDCLTMKTNHVYFSVCNIYIWVHQCSIYNISPLGS